MMSTAEDPPHGNDLPPLSPINRYERRYLHYRPLLLALIQSFTAQHGYAPSLRNLAAEAGLAPNTVRKYLRRMRLEGLIDFSPGIPRTIHRPQGSP